MDLNEIYQNEIKLDANPRAPEIRHLREKVLCRKSWRSHKERKAKDVAKKPADNKPKPD